jgi:hypothetical protein
MQILLYVPSIGEEDVILGILFDGLRIQIQRLLIPLGRKGFVSFPI